MSGRSYFRGRRCRFGGPDIVEKTMTNSAKGTALVTGASTGIGAIYADRLARRGVDLILVARNRDRLEELAKRLSAETGRSVEVTVADLNSKADLARVETRLRTDTGITMLVNNAGLGAAKPLLASDIDKMEEMISLNVTALTRLTYAVAPGFSARGNGAIINIASMTAIWPEILNGVYSASKAFVLAFSQSLHHEFKDKNIKVQVVLPGVTATDFWQVAEKPVQDYPAEIVMRAEDLVDAALAGFDQGEFVTIPSLADASEWEVYEGARQKLMPNLSRRQPAARYKGRVAA
jgi:short-subunit dehydrogenase